LSKRITRANVQRRSKNRLATGDVLAMSRWLKNPEMKSRSTGPDPPTE